MSWIESLILGLIQGLTEFLPVSSSGHLELGKFVLGVELEENLFFTVMVHVATVLSTLVVFRKDIAQLFIGLFKFQWNEETQYVTKIVISLIPIAIVGLFFKDFVDDIFNMGNMVLLVGIMLVITAGLLTLAYYYKSGDKDITFKSALIIGISQAVAVVPGLSRSGTTIATGLLLGTKKELVAKFSFLMVLVPILGETFLEIVGFEGSLQASIADVGAIPLLVGFLTAFVSGLAACKWMINIVRRGKLIGFAIYCLVVAVIAITVGLI